MDSPLWGPNFPCPLPARSGHERNSNVALRGSALILEPGVSDTMFESFRGRPVLSVSYRSGGVIEVQTRYAGGWPIVAALALALLAARQHQSNPDDSGKERS